MHQKVILLLITAYCLRPIHLLHIVRACSEFSVPPILNILNVRRTQYGPPLILLTYRSFRSTLVSGSVVAATYVFFPARSSGLERSLKAGKH